VPQSITVTEKLCTKCGVVRPASDFSRDPRSRDGLSWPCKPCRRDPPRPCPDLPGEEWRSVVGFEGIYDVSSLGRIRRVANGPSTFSGKIIKPIPNRDGYTNVRLYRDGGYIHRRVHQIVAAAFLGPCPPGHEVNHKRAPKTNNGVANIEYVTRRGNNLHAHATGLNHTQHGSAHKRAKLTEAQIPEIRELRKAHTLRELAERYGVSLTVISRVCRGETWKHVA
jgi:hypothetical protein